MLIGVVWMPVIAYRSSRDILLCARASIPSSANRGSETAARASAAGIEQRVIHAPSVHPNPSKRCSRGALEPHEYLTL